MTAQPPSAVTLAGQHVRLEPLSLAHLPELYAASGGDDEVWRWLPPATPRSEAEFAAELRGRLDDPDCVPFAVVELSGGRAVGSTCYYDADPEHEQLEIGGTWYARSVWRSPVNTEAKLLLLDHAFGELGMGRVSWRTDVRNERSQAAIRRLGATYEGTLRRVTRRSDGSWRDSVFFAMLAEEWPQHRARLAERLARGSAAGEPR